MNLEKHYEAYRKSVMRDALGESSWYARQIRTAAGEPAYDWLSRQVETIKNDIKQGAAAAYKSSLEQHQRAMIQLYEAMVTDHMWDYRQVTPQNMLDLIDERGANWFKFSKRHLKFSVEGEPMLWVPRYIYPWQGMMSAAVCFDADELHLLSKRQDVAKKAFTLKKSSPMRKLTLVVDDEFQTRSPWFSNSEHEVLDWTAPLFLKPEDMQA